jgi:hypothetical protein
MGPDYLQRVAIAGSRTSAPPRPAVVGPPSMPGRDWPAIAVGSDTEARPAIQPASEGEFVVDKGLITAAESQTAAVAITQGASTRPASIPNTWQPVGVPVNPSGHKQEELHDDRRVLASNYLQHITIAGSRIGVVTTPAVVGPPPTPRSEVQEEPSLSPVAPQELRAATQSIPRPDDEAGIRAASGLRPVPTPLPTAADERTERRSVPDEPTRPALRAEIQSILPPGTEAVISAPRGLRPVRDPPPAALYEPTVSLPSNAESQARAAEALTPTLREIERRSGTLNNDASGAARLQLQAAAEPIARDDLKPAPSPVRPPHPPTHRLGTVEPERHPVPPLSSVLAVAPTQQLLAPKAYWEPVMPPIAAAGTNNRSHISIGRVEVQVNNRLPQLPIVSRPEPIRVPRSASGSLEAHYLDRFTLRR